MSGVFISYRRTDTDSALLLYSWLRERFGAEQVFWDREDIPPGSRYDDVLIERIRSAEALVALIGPTWVSVTDAVGVRRLESSTDWVRREIATALELERLVLPVLMSGTEPPSVGELPADLRELARLEALQLSDLRLRERLLAALDRVVPAAVRPAADGTSAQIARMQRLLRRQLARLQTRALELIDEGKTDRAGDELREGSELMLALVETSPPDVELYAQLGYMYSTLAQNFELAGAPDSTDRYVDLSARAFERVLSTATPDRTDDIASALNGLAGVYRQRGDYERAIELYQQALQMVPSYGYAWHDLFAILDQRASDGRIDAAALEHALERARATGLGQAGLSEQYFAGLEQRLRDWKERAAADPSLVAPIPGSPGP